MCIYIADKCIHLRASVYMQSYTTYRYIQVQGTGILCSWSDDVLYSHDMQCGEVNDRVVNVSSLVSSDSI